MSTHDLKTMTKLSKICMKNFHQDNEVFTSTLKSNHNYNGRLKAFLCLLELLGSAVKRKVKDLGNRA